MVRQFDWLGLGSVRGLLVRLPSRDLRWAPTGGERRRASLFPEFSQSLISQLLHLPPEFLALFPAHVPAGRVVLHHPCAHIAARDMNVGHTPKELPPDDHFADRTALPAGGVDIPNMRLPGGLGIPNRSHREQEGQHQYISG
jgi:hypothetical protein